MTLSDRRRVFLAIATMLALIAGRYYPQPLTRLVEWLGRKPDTQEAAQAQPKTHTVDSIAPVVCLRESPNHPDYALCWVLPPAGMFEWRYGTAIRADGKTYQLSR